MYLFGAPSRRLRGPQRLPLQRPLLVLARCGGGMRVRRDDAPECVARRFVKLRRRGLVVHTRTSLRRTIILPTRRRQQRAIPRQPAHLPYVSTSDRRRRPQPAERVGAHLAFTGCALHRRPSGSLLRRRLSRRLRVLLPGALAQLSRLLRPTLQRPVGVLPRSTSSKPSPCWGGWCCQNRAGGREAP